MFVVKIIVILLLVFCGSVSSKEELNTLDDKYTYIRTGYVADCKDTLSIDYKKKLRFRGIPDAIGRLDMLAVEDVSYTDSILKVRKERVLKIMRDILASEDVSYNKKIRKESALKIIRDAIAAEGALYNNDSTLKIRKESALKILRDAIAAEGASHNNDSTLKIRKERALEIIRNAVAAEEVSYNNDSLHALEIIKERASEIMRSAAAEEASYNNNSPRALNTIKEIASEIIREAIAAEEPLYKKLSHAFKIHEEFEVDTERDVSKIIMKQIYCGGIRKRLYMKYDSIGNLEISGFDIENSHIILSSRVELWDKGKLVQTKYNKVYRDIVQDKTPCNLRVLSKKEATFIIQLDPEKEPLPLIQEDVIEPYEVYDVIKYHWYPHCKKYHETKKAAETNLSLENEPGVPVKNDDNSSSYLLPYKYYFIILVCIVIASVVVVYRKRKVGRK